MGDNAPVARLGQLGAAFRNGDLRRVELAWTGCITAELAGTVALAVVAHRLGGLSAVGLLGLVRALPAAVLGPFVAAVTDRGRRGTVLCAVLAIRSVLLLAAAGIAASTVPDELIFAVAALDALVYSAWWPTQSALIPELAASPDEATAANVGTTLIESFGTLLGPLLGAVLLIVGSPAWVFGVAAGFLGAAAVIVSPLARRSGTARPEPDLPASVAPRWRALAGFRVALRDPAPRAVIGLYLLQTFALGALGTLIVAASIDLLDLGDEGIGLLNAAVGAGGMVGALGSVALVGRRRLGSALGLALLGWGAAVAFAGALPGVAVVLTMLAVVGAGNAVVDVAALTLLQRIVPDDVLVRVLGVFEGLWWAMLGTGAVAGASLAEALGARGALVVVGVLLPSAAVVAVGSLRALDRAAGPPADVLERLQQVPFFAPLPAPALERLGFAAGRVPVIAGQLVIEAGETGDAFYVVEDGRFAVEVPGQGDVPTGMGFGEIALLRDVPRTATVRAATDGSLLRIRRDVFLGALSLDPASHEVAQAHADRLLSAPPDPAVP